MSSDRITPGSSLLETMRALAQGKVRSTSAATSAPSVNATKIDQASSISEHSTAQLRQRLQSLVADTDVDDPAAMEMAREPVLREIILWEFGSDFRQSTHFQPMIERINQAMDLDERFRAQFVDMVQNLKH